MFVVFSKKKLILNDIILYIIKGSLYIVEKAESELFVLTVFILVDAHCSIIFIFHYYLRIRSLVL